MSAVSKNDKVHEKVRFGLLREYLAAGIGCSIADSIFNPLEVIKVRLQMQSDVVHIASFTQTKQVALKIISEDGISGLWTPGLVATCLRGIFYTGFRIGMYPTVKRKVTENIGLKPNSFGVMMLSGATTGGIGSFLFHPIDVVRVRFQKNPNIYPSTFRAFHIIYTKEGIHGLWSGVSASVARSMLLSGAQLSAYEQTKKRIIQCGCKDSIPVQAVASLLSGVVAQTFVMPVDVIKTRLIVLQRNLASTSTTSSSVHQMSNGNILPCMRTILREGGVKALYRGLLPAVARQGPCILVQMPIVEHIRCLLGVGYL
eukprot:gene3388-6721_t